MVKLIGNFKINCAVFISGRGTNLKSIYEYSKIKKSNISLKLVISNKSNTLGIDFARKYKIKTQVVRYKNKNEAEKKIIKCLKKK